MDQSTAAIFRAYWGPGPARSIPITPMMYRGQLASMVDEARNKPGLSGLTNNTLAPIASLQTAALLLGPGISLTIERD